MSVLSVGSAASHCTPENVQRTLLETAPPAEEAGLQTSWDLEMVFAMKTSNEKSPFPLRPRRCGGFPSFPCVLGLSPIYTLSSPVGLAWPQPTLKPIHISGEGSPRVFVSCNQDNFLACLEINSSCKFLPLSTASERFLTQSQPIHQQLPGVLFHNKSCHRSSARVSTSLNCCSSPTAGHAARKCPGLLLWPA